MFLFKKVLHQRGFHCLVFNLVFSDPGFNAGNGRAHIPFLSFTQNKTHDMTAGTGCKKPKIHLVTTITLRQRQVICFHYLLMSQTSSTSKIAFWQGRTRHPVNHICSHEDILFMEAVSLMMHILVDV